MNHWLSFGIGVAIGIAAIVVYQAWIFAVSRFVESTDTE